MRGKKHPPRLVFLPFLAPTRGTEPLYQSQERTCSGNDAELIAFNPDAADNLEAGSPRQRRVESMQERETAKQEGRKRRWKGVKTGKQRGDTKLKGEKKWRFLSPSLSFF